MIQTAEQLARSVRELPASERERFFQLIGSSSATLNGGSSRSEEDEKFEKALGWIEQNRTEYDGQFVLLDGDQLLAHGAEPDELYQKARELGIRTPFVKRIRAEVQPFGGW